MVRPNMRGQPERFSDFGQPGIEPSTTEQPNAETAGPETSEPAAAEDGDQANASQPADSAAEVAAAEPAESAPTQPTEQPAGEPAGVAADSPTAEDPGFGIFDDHREPEKVFDAEQEQHTGAVLGIALANYRAGDGKELFVLLPGDDVTLTVPTGGQPPKASMDTFTVVDFYESKMSEYDSAFVFVPLARLQKMRGMVEPDDRRG